MSAIVHILDSQSINDKAGKPLRAGDELLKSTREKAIELNVSVVYSYQSGPVEATAIGNIMVQAIALGCLPSIAEGRKLIRRSFELVEYQPQEQDVWDEAYQRFVKIC